jgi:hypothetical protein
MRSPTIVRFCVFYGQNLPSAILASDDCDEYNDEITNKLGFYGINIRKIYKKIAVW